MSSYYQYLYGQLDWDDFLAFDDPTRTVFVTENVTVQKTTTTSNLICDNLINPEINQLKNLIGSQTTNNVTNYTFNYPIEITSNIVLKSGQSNSNKTTIRNLDNIDVIASVSIANEATSNTVKLEDDWYDIYGENNKIRISNDVWLGTKSLFGNNLTCRGLFYDSGFKAGMQNNVDDVFGSITQSLLSSGNYTLPPHTYTRRTIIDPNDGYIPYAAIKGAPTLKKIQDSVEGAVIGATVGTGLFSFLGGAASGFLFRQTLYQRQIPRPPGVPQIPSTTNGDSMAPNRGQTTTATDTPANTNGTTPADGVPRPNPRETDQTEGRDRRTGNWRSRLGSRTRRIEEESSRCCGCFGRRRTTYSSVPTIESEFVGGSLLDNPLYDPFQAAGAFNNRI